MAFNSNDTLLIEKNNSSFKLFKDYISKINFLFIATDECTRNYSKSYCTFSALIVLCGYLCFMCIMPLVIYRLMQLKTKFRNQYNLSLLWMCSILLIGLIDLTEFIAIGNGKIYSIVIIFIQCVFIVTCIVSILCLLLKKLK